MNEALRAMAAAPKAIAMWDFSWLERRWAGGGYEDWDEALDGLVERGYDAVRIDAYPHLVTDEASSHTLIPVWDQHEWGATRPITVSVKDSLAGFVERARAHGVAVGLSSWFRRDVTERRMAITSPRLLGEWWARTLGFLDEAGVLDNILYVDLCNEWPLSVWAPFLYGDVEGGKAAELAATDPVNQEWMTGATAVVRESYPGLPLTFSGWYEPGEDVSALDFLEPHIWMTDDGPGQFYTCLGYDIVASNFDPHQYEILAGGAEALYRSDVPRWRAELTRQIDEMAGLSRATGLPLMTTECWGIVNWKDRADLPWGWVKELCEIGVAEAISRGRWVAMATSNFCGPQFPGMWDDVAWHRRLTGKIKAARCDLGKC